MKKKIGNENDNLIKRTTTYLNTFCKLRDQRKLLINLYYTRNPVLINENMFSNEIFILGEKLGIRQETCLLARTPSNKDIATI